MKKFVFRMQEGGKDFFLMAQSLEEAKDTLKKTFGSVPYMVSSTNFRAVRMPINQAQFEYSC